MRSFTVNRTTAETNIALTLDLNGTGRGDIATGVGFLDHMLTLFARHGRFDLSVRCEGDTQVDDHHSVEDIGICLGTAFAAALGDKAGICRYGDATIPMDEALVLCAVDISGRPHLAFEAEIPTQKVGTFDTELVQEFFEAFTRSAGVTLHLRQLAGKNSHHVIEAIFKAAGRALRAAATVDETLCGAIPSTKGVL